MLDQGDRHRDVLRQHFALQRVQRRLGRDRHQARRLAGRGADQAVGGVLGAELAEAVFRLAGDRVFLALQYLTKAGWSVAFRRVPEALTGLLPGAALLMIVCLVSGLHQLYEWSHADVVAQDAILSKKAAWLNPSYFLIRAIAYLAVWVLFATLITRYSRLQDESGDSSCSRINARLSPLFVVIMALTLSAASFDWIMSIDAHWFSTVFAVYNFAGLFESSWPPLSSASSSCAEVAP